MACEEVVDMVVKVLTGASHLVTLVEKEWGYFRDWKTKRKEADEETGGIPLDTEDWREMVEARLTVVEEEMLARREPVNWRQPRNAGPLPIPRVERLRVRRDSTISSDSTAFESAVGSFSHRD
ncbi:hypothetical protein SNK03_007353 [Fusarium graminearum]